MANRTGRHFSCVSLKHFFYEHRAVGETPSLLISRNGSGRSIHVVELLWALAPIGRYRPTAQELICGPILLRNVQISIRISNARGFQPVGRKFFGYSRCAANAVMADGTIAIAARVLAINAVATEIFDCIAFSS